MFRIALTLFAIVGTTLSGVILIAMLATPNFIIISHLWRSGPLLRVLHSQFLHQ